jgi:hypothetical protein
MDEGLQTVVSDTITFVIVCACNPNEPKNSVANNNKQGNQGAILILYFKIKRVVFCHS